MDKKKIALLTMSFFLFSMTPVFPTTKAYAYSNPAYMNDIKIGLEHMAASTLVGKLTGDYYLNGNLITSGTVLNFKITNGKVNINGIEYGSVSLSPKAYGNLLALTSGTETNNYLGVFTFKVDNGRVYPVNSLGLEDYLKGVVPYEMSDSFPMEALKTQAVAARTYALKSEGALMQTKGFDFDDTINYQVYYGYNPANKNSIQAVLNTKGQVETYNDNLIYAYFGASDGGYTENIMDAWGYSTAYLIAKPDVYNGQTIDNGAWSYGSKSFTIANIDSTLKTKGYLASTDTFVKLDLNSITRDSSGRVSNINLIYNDSTGIQHVKYITGDRCRTFLSLQSSMWNASFDGTYYNFTGKGYGHGIGMSQIGAKQRASLGQTYDQILKFYYDSTQIANLYTTPSISSYTESSNQVYVGQPISLNTMGLNGTGRYQYKFTVMKDGAYVTDTGFTDSPNYTYTPAQTGNYQFIVYLKDVESTQVYDASQSLSASVINIPTAAIGSYTESSSQNYVGNAVNFNTTASGGSGQGCLYKYVVSNNGQVIATQDYSSNNSFNFTPSAAGNYKITSYVKDALSSNAYDDTKDLSLTVYNYSSITSASLTNTQLFAGQSTNVNIAASGGNGSYLYKYVVANNGTIVSTRDYSSDPNFSYSPSSAGNYTITAYLKDTLSTKDFDDSYAMNLTAINYASISSFSLDKPQLLAGQNVNFTASAANGTGSYLYKYVISKNGTVVVTRDYNSTSTYSFTPTDGGNYTAVLYVKDAASSQDYDSTQSLSFTSYLVPSISSFISTKTTDLVGQSISYTTQAQNGSGNYQYKYVITNSADNSVVYTKDYSNDGNLVYTPTAAGNYSVTVYIKDNLSTNAYEDTKSITLSAINAPSISNPLLDKSQILLGQGVNASVGVVGGSGSYQYKYQISQNGTVVFTQDYSLNSTLAYTPTASGNYDVTVYVKDMASDNTYDVSSKTSIVVYDVPTITNFAVDTNTPLTGEPMNFTALAQGGSGDISYKFVVLKDWNFVTETPFGSSTSYSYIPTQPGNYEVYVYIKDKLETNQNSGYKRLLLTAYAAPQMSTTTASGYMYAGKPVNIVAANTIGSPLGTNLKYEVYKNGSLYTSKDFSTSTSFGFTPNTAGTYTLKVYVKDLASKNAYDDMKSFDLSIQAIPVTVTTLPLSYGMTSPDVTSVQNALIKLGYSISSATGYFGTQTQSAVISFQKDKGLSRTGVVDQTTLNAINDSLIGKSGIKNLTF
ncbi:MAG: SpoIID/LytB domain-containing protein [Bacillota bacterium]|nr:SpoIID/LytB domain-containing protein [Bacillota bacterium]